MPLVSPILHTTLGARRPDRQGKVRDIYDFGDQLLIVATDRISAFDYVLGSGTVSHTHLTLPTILRV